MKKLLLVFILAILFLFACKSDVSIEANSLTGQWDLISAKRNGNTTSTLDKAFFSFTDGSLSHNINGEVVTSKYEKKSNKLIIYEDDILTEIELLSLVKDTLEISTKIQNFKFDFRLKKKNE